jgi:hypothetical protein
MKAAMIMETGNDAEFGRRGLVAASTAGEGCEMDGDVCADDFEQRLIEHVEMLFLVAMNLTRNNDAAEFITHGALSEAWNNRRHLQGKKLKAELLTLLRLKFDEYRGIVGLRRIHSSSFCAAPNFEESPCDAMGRYGRVEFATMS